MVLAVVVFAVTKRGQLWYRLWLCSWSLKGVQSILFFLPSDFLTPGIEWKYCCYNAVRK